VGAGGGGLDRCNGEIENNTVASNSADLNGAGLANCGRRIVNCIIWGNGGGSQPSECSVPRYSCIEGWIGEGQGNIAEDPRFVDPDVGCFQLLPSSPCIDAGENPSTT